MKDKQICCALHLLYASCKYDDLFLNAWKSKTTRNWKETKNPKPNTLDWKMEGINLCKPDTALKKTGLTTLILMNVLYLVASRGAKVNHLKKS